MPTRLGIPKSWVDTDAALTANSDSKIATQKAVKAYVDVGAVGLQEATPGAQQTGHDNLSGTRIGGGFVAQNLASLTTPAESWVGPSSTTGVYFKGGNVGIGTTSPEGKLTIDNGDVWIRSGYAMKLRNAANSEEFHIYSEGIPGLSYGLLFRSNLVDLMFIHFGGNVGIGTTSPTNFLSFGGNAARTVWMERHTTANNAGNSLTIQAGGATAAATDKAGGQLILKPGVATGTGESGVTLQGCVAGLTGTGDNSFQDMIKILGNKMAFFNVTAVLRQVVPTGSSTDSIITALQNLGLFSNS